MMERYDVLGIMEVDDLLFRTSDSSNTGIDGSIVSDRIGGAVEEKRRRFYLFEILRKFFFQIAEYHPPRTDRNRAEIRMLVDDLPEEIGDCVEILQSEISECTALE